MGTHIEHFEFELRTRTVFGPGRVAELADILTDEGAETVGVVVDGGVVEVERIVDTINTIREADIEVHVFENDVAEPHYEYLDEFKNEMAGPDYDFVVGIGGGSSIDLAKGMATLLENDGPAIEYRGFPDLPNEPVPVVAVPTTAGTGSEITFNAVFSEHGETPRDNRKMGINSRYNYPEYAIVDPELTLTCPEEVVVSAGMDALVHTFESFGASEASNYSRMYSERAFGLLADNLDSVLQNPEDISIRASLSLGSHYAGAALVNSGAGPAGALSYPLGAVYGVPHGLAGAVFLPKIARYNVDHGYTGYAALYDQLDGADLSISQSKKADRVADRVEDLCEALDVPNSLDQFGVAPEDVDFLVERTRSDLTAALEMNPVEIHVEDVREILESMVET